MHKACGVVTFLIQADARHPAEHAALYQLMNARAGYSEIYCAPGSMRSIVAGCADAVIIGWAPVTGIDMQWKAEPVTQVIEFFDEVQAHLVTRAAALAAAACELARFEITDVRRELIHL